MLLNPNSAPNQAPPIAPVESLSPPCKTPLKQNSFQLPPHPNKASYDIKTLSRPVAPGQLPVAIVL